MTTYSPFSRPLYIMAKPAGARCNLACSYCYYLEKEKLYADLPGDGVMSDDLLELFIKQYIEAQTSGEVLFTWHGGEPLLRPLSFYRKAVSLQKKYASGRRIDNCLQTNGTLLDENWARFLHDEGWLVGISIDGPQEIHDTHRRAKGNRPSFQRVMRGIRLLNRYGVEWNALAVVNSLNVTRPIEFYRFFKEIDCRYIQFTPIVERFLPHTDGRRLAAPCEGLDDTRPKTTALSVTPEAWGEFLCKVFDEWVKEDVGSVFIQLFDSTLAGWMGVTPGLCMMGETCGHAAAMTHNGDLYVCDHFVFPEYRLGNIRQTPITTMMYSPRMTAFGRAKRDSLPRQCRECDFLFACHGECPKNRFVRTADGEPGLNYLCRGYHVFFTHVAPYMDYMKRQLQRELPPANVMEAIRRGEFEG